MRITLDIALLIAIGLWAVLEFYLKTESGILNALILFGVIWRFGVTPTYGRTNGQQSGGKK